MDGLNWEGFGTKIGKERLGAEPSELSPVHHVQAGAPPTIIFHGKTDETVPYRTAEAFATAMRKAGNRCELVGYDEQAHGFFNFGRGDGRYYNETLAVADAFLVSLGYLPPPHSTKPSGQAARRPAEAP